MLSILFAVSAMGASFAIAGPAKDGMSPLCGGPAEPCPDGPAVFVAKGSETRRITIGGHIKTEYQFVDVGDSLRPKRFEPEEYNNFKMKNIRLSVNAELCEGWSGFMNLDFAGDCKTSYKRALSSAQGDNPTYATANVTGDGTGQEYLDIQDNCTCKSKCCMYVDQAYIQKVWLDATFRFGYQKVNFGAEENTPDEHLKTIERSVATHFFTNLGRRVVAGNTTGASNTGTANDSTVPTGVRFTGQRLGGRHTGIYAAGQVGAFHYSGALTSGYQGLCCTNSDLNNSFNAYASMAFEFGIDCVDFLVGVNGAFSDKGTNLNAGRNLNVWAVNPYAFLNYDRLSVMFEAFYGSVQKSVITIAGGDANPWGVNLIPTFMLNDNWELVGRFSFVNSDKMGMTIDESFGCAPDLAFPKSNGNGPTYISSLVVFEKVYSGYIGMNYYMLDGAVKASLGLEQVKYKNRFIGAVNPNNGSASTAGTFDTPSSCGAKLNVVRASLQFLF